MFQFRLRSLPGPLIESAYCVQCTLQSDWTSCKWFVYHFFLSPEFLLELRSVVNEKWPIFGQTSQIKHEASCLIRTLTVKKISQCIFRLFALYSHSHVKPFSNNQQKKIIEKSTQTTSRIVVHIQFWEHSQCTPCETTMKTTYKQISWTIISVRSLNGYDDVQMKRQQCAQWTELNVWQLTVLYFTLSTSFLCVCQCECECECAKQNNADQILCNEEINKQKLNAAYFILILIEIYQDQVTWDSLVLQYVFWCRFAVHSSFSFFSLRLFFFSFHLNQIYETNKLLMWSKLLRAEKGHYTLAKNKDITFD